MTTILKHVRWYDYLYLVVCQAISYIAISSKYISFYQIYLQKAPSVVLSVCNDALNPGEKRLALSRDIVCTSDLYGEKSIRFVCTYYN